MSMRVYISADYALNNGDKDVVEELQKWGKDDLHKTNFCDTAQVVSGSVSNDPDCRPCDLKKEFNNQINVSSAVIFVIGDKTASRTAGSSCRRETEGAFCSCTPYKQNANGSTFCKVTSTHTPGPNEDLGSINSFSYLKHEFLQAKRKNKNIIIVYNSVIKQPSWLPSYMKDHEDVARPFWKRNYANDTVGDYEFIKQELGYD